MIQVVEKDLYSADWSGVWHAVLTFGTMLAIIVGVIVKWGQSNDSQKIKTTESDLNKIGEKVGVIQDTCARAETKHEELKDRVSRVEIVQAGILTSTGKLESGIDSLAKQNVQLHTDIMGAISETAKLQTLETTKLAIQVARLDESQKERENLRQTMEQFIRSLRDGKQ